MCIAERNKLVEENMILIQYAIRRNKPLIYALRLDTEDVAQDLSEHLIRAVETYDSSKGMKLTSYISYKLQFGILAMRQKLNRKCRAIDEKMLYIDKVDEDSQPFEIPVNVDYDSDLYAGEIIDLLSDGEKEVLGLKMNGASLQDKKQKRYMDRVQRKVTRFYGKVVV